MMHSMTEVRGATGADRRGILLAVHGSAGCAVRPRQDRYDPVTGAYTGATVFFQDGTPKTVTSVAPDGTPLLTVYFKLDGSSATEIQAPARLSGLFNSRY